MAHTLYEDRDLNSSHELFDGLGGIKADPEMVQLATQPVQRQTGLYDSADLEDRYETRLRAMIDTKLKGEGIDLEAEEPVTSTGSVSLGAIGCIGHALLVVGIESNAVPGMWIDDCQRTS
jgi:non-homologous end joining protein Ku